MKKTAVFTVTVVALASATSAAMADQRWVHKSSDAGIGANCGANSNVNDAVNGPCTTLTAAYNNAKAAGGNVARLMILSSGGFNESLTLDWGNGPSEIRSVGDSKPGLNGLAGQNSLVINTLSDVRLFDFRIGGQSGAGLNNIQAVGALGTLELHRMELRGAGGFGINIQPTSGNGPNSVSTVYIVDSNIANASQGLIQIRPVGNTTVGTVIKNTQIHHGTGFGVKTDSSASSSSIPVKTLISNSVVTNVTNAAVNATAPASGGAHSLVLIENTDVLNANNGTVANGENASVVLNNATILGNGVGVNIVGGTVWSYGNNVISFNTTQITGGVLNTQSPQ